MANYAFVENDNIEVYDLLPKNWRNISNFSSLDDWNYLNTLGWYQVTKLVPENYDSVTQKLDNARWTFTGSQVNEEYDVIDLPVVVEPEPIPQETIDQIDEGIIANRWDIVRAERDRLIKEFEWRYLRRERHLRLGIPILDTLQKMDEYMQALANVTLQENPLMIEWPVYVSDVPSPAE